MPDLPDLTNTVAVLYKAKDGMLKELHIKHNVKPDQIKLTLEDMCYIARKISEELRKDAF